MPYVPIPKDLTNVKTKFLFNLTKRQLICFGVGALVAVPVFFLLKPLISSSTAVLVMMLTLAPFFLLAMYEKNGQPLEKIVRNMLNVIVFQPKTRPYRTNNFYSALEKQDKLDKEVYNIVSGRKTDAK